MDSLLGLGETVLVFGPFKFELLNGILSSLVVIKEMKIKRGKRRLWRHMGLCSLLSLSLSFSLSLSLGFDWMRN